MELTKKKNRHKIFGLFSAIRFYNITLLVLAQYLTAIYVFSIHKTLGHVLFNYNLHLIVFSTICVVAAGYLINDFYDVSVDVINKPIKTHISNWVSKTTKLKVYFILNFAGFTVAFFVSVYAAIFSALYIFFIWFYSHKLQKKPVIRIFSISILDIFPFFIVFVFYRNISEIILMHALFLFSLLFVKEVVKDFTRIRGALLNNRETLITLYGAKKVKYICMFIFILLVLTSFYILSYPEIGKMKIYFYCFIVFVVPFCVLLFKANREKQYQILHNILKGLLVLGVFSLTLIDTSVLLLKLLR